RHHQVEPAVAIVIDEGASCPPGLPASGNTGRLPHFREDPTLIVIKPVLSVVRDVEVFPSIVVVVADADTLAPAVRGQPGLGGHIGKSSVVLVAIQMIGGRRSCRKSFKRGAVYQENIGPAIVVVIENRRAGSGGLDDVLLSVFPAENLGHGQPGFFCRVHEIGDGRAFSALGDGSGDQGEKPRQSCSGWENTRLRRKNWIHGPG